MDSNGQIANTKSIKRATDASGIDTIVLDKAIFSNVFEKDIRRVYIYKKAERLAKAIHLVSPAFRDVKVLRERLQRLSVDLVDASVMPPAVAKETLSRELLSLSSVLSMARSAGMLSPMNADIIMREAHHLLQEIAGYEDPRITLDEVPSLASLAKAAPAQVRKEVVRMPVAPHVSSPVLYKGHTDKGQIMSKKDKSDRKEAILSILSSKGPVDIKDLSTLIRDVSEKTIQRELQSLVEEGRVSRTGERRWTRYSLAGQSAPVPAPIDANAVEG